MAIILNLFICLLFAAPAFAQMEIRASGGYTIGEAVPPDPPPCTDGDGDGFGSPASYGCQYWTLDCDDTSSAIYPGAGEICGDGIDQNCDGADLPCVGGPVRAFPGAMGFGTDTRAGRGGQVIHVTNLNDSGTGSLREALMTTGPRIIVFDVSGTIDWTSGGRVEVSGNDRAYLTVAGQTAPFPGIAVKGAELRITTHDVLIQHMRFRPGDTPTDNMADGIFVLGTSAYNVVVDHCSTTWAPDENFVLYSGSHDVTYSNGIAAESLGWGNNGAEYHGMLIGYDSTNVSVLRSLLANNEVRNPYIQEGTSVVFANNIGYNNASSGFVTVTAHTSGTTKSSKVSVEGNHWIGGPRSQSGVDGINVSSALPPSSIYATDNLLSNSSGQAEDIGSHRVGSRPIWHDSITTISAAATKAHVLANAGAWPAFRDAIDSRIISQANGETQGIHPYAVEQWKGSPYLYTTGNTPTLTYNNSPFTEPANPSGDDDGDDWTNIEEVLAQCATYVETGTGSCPR